MYHDPMLRSAIGRSCLRTAVVLALTCAAGAAWSSSGGITGKSGKQGGSCNGCHQGGTTPTVKLEGPTSLDAGAVALYTFRVATDAAITGMNAAVSVSDGVMASDPDGGGTREDDNEIVHAQPVRPDAGQAVYRFAMTAPPYGGKITLYAAGNACNNDGKTDGDESARTALDIEVNGPPRPPPAAPAPGPKPPAQESPIDAAPPTGDAGATSDVAPEEDSGCSIAWTDRSSAPAGAALAALAALAAVWRGRRHRGE